MNTYKKTIPILLISLISSLMLAVGLVQGRPLTNPSGTPSAPTDMKCLGLAEDEVKLVWIDNADDETNYIIERRIGNGSWNELDVIPLSNDNKPVTYKDSGIDSSNQNYFYRVRAYRVGDDSYSDPSQVCNNRRIYESDNFRIFYGLEGTADECPDVMNNDVCLNDPIHLIKVWGALEGARASFLRVGFEEDVADSSYDKEPVTISMCDGGGCGGTPLQLAPFIVEANYNLFTNQGDPSAHVVTAHELFHRQQGKYGFGNNLNDPAPKWVIEGQARSIQDKVCFGGDRDNCIHFDAAATGYAGYVPQVNTYMGNTNRPINEASYTAALFWTYLTEQYGLYEPSDPVEGGMDIIVNFWEDVADNPGRDSLTVLNSTLADMGYSQTFRDVWKDFAVANYAKDLSGPNVPTKYQYQDMTQPGGNYDEVALTLDVPLALGEQVIDTDQSVTQWGANYYRLHPDNNVSFVDLNFIQDTPHMLYYTVLVIKNGDLVDEYNSESRDYSLFLSNDNIDEVVIVVAGLENPANYRFSINGTEPELRIKEPDSDNIARVGAPAAPDKFLARIEIIAPDGSPVTGVDLDNFTFMVGNESVPAANILTAATVQNQQWFVIRAPGQAANGIYNLSVSYNEVLAGENLASVSYIPRDDADNVIIFDRSASMGLDDKLQSAQAAASLYVDSWRYGDQIGVVSFNFDPYVELGLTPWTDEPGGGSRLAAINAISGLTAEGSTAIGDALRSGWDDLIQNGQNDHDWAMILLSDGEETLGVSEETFDELIEDLENTAGKQPVVHAIALGADADRARMQAVAVATGGIYDSVSVPSTIYMTESKGGQIVDLQLDLSFRYRMIASEVLGKQPFFTFVGPMDDGDPESDIVPIQVENGAAELFVSLSWVGNPNLSYNSVLRNPMGNAVSQFKVDDEHIVWRVTNPMGGEWSLSVEGPPPVPGPDPVSGAILPLPAYLVQATVQSDITMDLLLTTPVADRHPGAPMGIVASLTDNASIIGAVVEADITSPSGNLFQLNLYDDGLHSDGAANDGLYGNIFYNTGEGGSYNVSVMAEGNSPLNGDFVRLKIAAFYLDGEEDIDLDNLPDGWEIYFFGSIEAYDANDDPDYDGCPNGTENYLGIDPTDPDTDDGGEADCFDEHSRDPSDDAIEPTWAVAYPGDAAVYLHYVDRSEPILTYATILRSIGREGPFTSHHFGIATSVFSDTTNIVNGTTYCYMVRINRTVLYDGTLSPITCATPRRDPLGPHGYILIEDGASHTNSDEVMLSLWATDHFDPEYAEAGPPQPVGRTVSGVTEMMISNRSDMVGAVWEAYTTSKAWTLRPQHSGLATVFVKYRDRAGNESDVYASAIYVNKNIYLPFIMR